MMHDFICCEELPQNTLTSAELETPLNTLLYGPLYCSLHPTHVLPSAVELQCKTHSTALDVLSSCGGALATAPVANLKNVESDDSKAHADRKMRLVQAFKSVINIDTCLIRWVFGQVVSAQLRGIIYYLHVKQSISFYIFIAAITF